MTLGCNIMNKLIQAKLQEPLKSYIELTHHSFTASNNKINVILDLKKPEKKQAYAKTDRKLPVVIPACTEMTVRTTTTKTKYPFEALVESNPRGLPAGLIISPSFQIVEDGQVCVQVSNYTEEDIYIPRNQKLAKVTLAEEVIPEYEMGVDNTGKKIVYLQEQHAESTSTDIPAIDLGDLF